MDQTKISGFFGNYRFLSNFWLTIVDYEGIDYPSSEHAFQAAKFLDKDNKLKILECKTPGQAKRSGKTLNPIRQDWEQIKDQIMYEILIIKFSNPILKQKLLNTGNIELIEENTWGDEYWGVCCGTGKNVLGKLLMKVREFYKNESSSP